MRTGTFEEAMLCPENMKAPESRYLDRGYGVYGMDEPRLKIANRLAPVNKSVLIIKDSYAIPIYSYLSTVFADITILDLRGRQPVSAVEYVHLLRPDIVCVMYNAGALYDGGGPFFEFGNAAQISRIAPGTYCREDCIKINQSASQFNHAVLYSGIEPSSRVSASVGSIESLGNDLDMVTVALYDVQHRKIVRSDRMAVGFPAKQTALFSVPSDLTTYRVLLYAGEPGKTANNAVAFNDVRLDCLMPQEEKE